MKRKLTVVACICIAIVASSYSNFKTVKISDLSQAKTSSVSKQEIEEGKALIGKSDCLACHKLQDKAVGPAYAAVAKKYPVNDANVTKLAQKIIKGGAGVWGQIPMSPHPTLSVGDAKKMVKYILSVK